MLDMFMKSKIDRISTLLHGLHKANIPPQLSFYVKNELGATENALLPGVYFSEPVKTDSSGCISFMLQIGISEDVHLDTLVCGRASINDKVIDFQIPAVYIVAVRVPGTPMVANFETIVPMPIEDQAHPSGALH